jgi:hypothetical protein
VHFAIHFNAMLLILDSPYESDALAGAIAMILSDTRCQTVAEPQRAHGLEWAFFEVRVFIFSIFLGSYCGRNSWGSWSW